MNTRNQSQNSTKPKYAKGDKVIMDGAEYEVIDFGDIAWNGVTYHDSYALWDTDDYGRIERRSYVDKYAIR